MIHHDPWTAWVRHPGHGAVLPYLLDETMVRAIECAEPGWPIAAPLDRLRRWQLLASGVTTLPAREEKLTLAWGRKVRKAREALERDGFVSVPGFLDSLHLARLRRYYRTLVRGSGRNGMQLGDKQTPGRHVAYNEPVARFFQFALAGAVSDIVGRPVKPTFSYSSAYVEGPGLPFHTDREQCEYTVSLLIDAWPEPDGFFPWPLLFETPKGRRKVYQRVGDGLFFRGRQLPHGRLPLAGGGSATALLFKYVDLDFEGPLR